MDKSNLSICSEIERYYLSGNFKKALDLCYNYLEDISDKVSIIIDSEEKIILNHECKDSCMCEHFLSLYVQFMFELCYSDVYIRKFIKNFYYKEEILPLVCVGLLANIYIHQEKLNKAQELIEKSIKELKNSKNIWSNEDKEKYYHILSTLILYTLLPQGFIDLALNYLSDDYHPSSVLPLKKDIYNELLLAINKSKKEYEKQFIPEPLSALNLNKSLNNEENRIISSSNIISKDIINKTIRNNDKNNNIIQNKDNYKQILRLCKILLPIGFISLFLSTLIYTFKKRNKYWIKKLLSSWELLESAIIPNYGIRRLQRNQQR